MFYFFFFFSAALVPILNSFFPVLNQPYTWWLIPAIVVGSFVALVILFLAVTAVSIALVNLNGNPEFMGGYYHFIIYNTLKFLVKVLRVKIHASGIELVPEDKRFLLVCNHINDIDPAVAMYILSDRDIAFIGKKEIYTDMKFVAKALHKLGGLPIDRENNREAAKTVIKAAKLIKEDKKSVGIFPEGYTSKTGELQEMRNGAFKIATKAECPIVVCSVYGTRQAVKHLFVKKSHIYFDVLTVIPEDEVSALSTAEIGDKVHKLLEENLEKYDTRR